MTSGNKNQLFATFNGNKPATTAAIRQLEREMGISLPTDYVDFLLQADGGEGFIGSAYLILWSASELHELNNAYQVAEYAPGLFLFGSDGGGEAFAFDIRTNIKPIISVPFVGMALNMIRPVCSTFTSFLEQMAKS